MSSPIPLSSDQIAPALDAAMAWWSDAGVDASYRDAPLDWFSQGPEKKGTKAKRAKAKQAEQPAPPPPPQSLFSGGEKPETLEAFAKWWMEDPALDPVGVGGRIGAHGPKQAQLMVLVMDPEASDKERLLSGPQGALLSKILNTSRISLDEVYFASAVPRHTPMPDTAALAGRGLSEVLLHHITLAEPKRLCAFGKSILPLLGHGMAQKSETLQEINHSHRTTALFVADGLESMMGSPALKRRFWQRWMQWLDGTSL